MDYISKNFDELSYAEKMVKEGRFYDACTNREIKVLAKYFRKQIAQEMGMELEEINKDYQLMKDVSREVERRVKKFGENATPRLSYFKACVAIQRAARLSEKFYACESNAIPITENEWQTIQELEDEDARKLLFMRLVDAKYNLWNRKTIGRYDYNDSEYFNREQISKEMYCREMKISRKNYIKANQMLHEKGLVEFKDIYSERFGVKHLEKVMILEDDFDAPIIDWVEDYHNILLHYERLCGEDIGTCKKCGRLFRQAAGRNKYKYCEEHRISNQRKNKDELAKTYKRPKKQKSTEPATRRCWKCYTRFELARRGNTSQQVFCKKCQAEINKQKKAEYMRRKRAEEKAKSGNEIAK